MRFHHIGIACNDIYKSKQKLKEYYSVKDETAIVYDENQRASVCLLTLSSGVNLELIDGEPVGNLLEKKVFYYHICFEVQDMQKSINNLKTNGAIVVSPPKPAVLFGGRRVAFLYTETGLVEFLEA